MLCRWEVSGSSINRLQVVQSTAARLLNDNDKHKRISASLALLY